LTLASPRSSYNDVFFQRREASDLVAASTPPQQVEETREALEKPEISEISQIPEIREVAAAPKIETSPDVPALGVEAISKVTEAPPIAEVAVVEAVVEVKPDLQVAGPAAPIDAVPELREEPGRVAGAPEATSRREDGPRPEAQKSGGFFKRLFGKFK